MGGFYDPQAVRCRGITLLGTPCSRYGYSDEFGLPMCFQHERELERAVWRWMYDNRARVRHMYREIIGEEIRRGIEEIPDPGLSVVYFVEREGFIKIGTSRNLEKRLQDIGNGSSMLPGMTVGPVRLIATMRGDRRHESFLHRRFHDLRVEYEWFVPGSELCQFIKHAAAVVDWALLAEMQVRDDPDESGEAA